MLLEHHSVNITNRYLLRIDTDQYSGAFERELASYITGQYGDSLVGNDQASDAEQTLDSKVLGWFAEHVEEVLCPETGCHEVGNIAPTPGYYNNGLGFHYTWDQREVAVDHYRCESLARADRFREDTEHDKKLRNLWLERAEKIDVCSLEDLPAYQSVEIRLNQVPPQDIWEIIKQRVYHFASFTGFNILDIRLLSQETKIIEEDIHRDLYESPSAEAEQTAEE